MNFEKTYKSVVYALVLVGLVPLSTSGEIPLPALLLTFIAVAHSWFRSLPMARARQRSRGWTITTFCAALLCLLYGGFSDRWLLAAIYFALVMVVVRLYQGRTARDVLQLYGLTFIAIIAGAVINPTIWFLFSFLVYVVLLVWGLVLLHLQRDLERLQRGGDQDFSVAAATEIDGETFDFKTRALVSRRFLAGTSVLALGVFVMSLAFFFFFPRLGMGFFFGQGRRGQAVSGFSDSIDLGHFGTIKDDMAVVMRVEIPGDSSDGMRHVRMRGISFDHYNGRSWTKTVSAQRSMPRFADDEWRVIYDFGAHPKYYDKGLVRQSIYIEPLMGERRVVFAEPRLMSLSITNARLDQLKHNPTNFLQGKTANADVTTGRGIRTGNNQMGAALQYNAVSSSYRPTDDELRAIRTLAPGKIRTVYTQRPETLDPAIKEQAERVILGAPTMHDKVLAVERFLLDNFGYTTEGGHDPERPLSDFLFNKKRGHCEYFSTAMVMLLRTVGIPARPANGFYGGAYNSYGSYYAVRQADAHSWVEVYYPDYGWLTFDPTPPSEVLIPAEEGWWASISEWFDSLRLRWYKWVVEYDLKKQLAFFTEIGKSIRSWFPSASGTTPDNSGKGWLDGLRAWAKDPATWLWVGTPIMLLVGWRLRIYHGLFAWLRRRRDSGRGGAPPAIAAYRQMLRSLSRLGLGRRQSETPRELVARLRQIRFVAADSAALVTSAFETALYQEYLALSHNEHLALTAALEAVAAVKRR